MIYKFAAAASCVLLLVFVYSLLKRRWFVCYAISFAILATCGPAEAIFKTPVMKLLRDIPFVLLAVAMGLTGALSGTASSWRGCILGGLLVCYGLLMLVMTVHPGSYGLIPAMAELRYYLVAPLCFFIARALARQRSFHPVAFWMALPVFVSALVGFTQLGWSQADYAAALGARYTSMKTDAEGVNLTPMGLSEGFLQLFMVFPIVYCVWIAVSRRDVSRNVRIFAYGAYFVLLIESVILRSRTGLVGALIASVIVVFASGRLRRSNFASVMVFGLFAALTVGSWQFIGQLNTDISMKKVETLLETSPTALIAEERGEHWSRGLRYLTRYPLGAGLGHSPTTWHFFRHYPGSPAMPLFQCHGTPPSKGLRGI